MTDTIDRLRHIRDELDRQPPAIPASACETTLMIWRREVLEHQAKVEAMDKAIRTLERIEPLERLLDQTSRAASRVNATFEEFSQAMRGQA